MGKRKKPDLESLSTSRVARTLRSAAASASFAASVVGGQLIGAVADRLRPGSGAAAQNRAAERFASSLGELKGLVMKLGQMLSYVDLTLPPEVQQVLATLQDSSQPMAPEVVGEVIRQELAARPENVFASWEPRPFAAASIGQVHRARLRDGTEVAVKVQYPEIARAFEADLNNIAIMQMVGSLLNRAMDHDGLIAEIRERFLEECDYTVEAANQSTFRSLYSGRREVVIPEVYPDYSSRRVLTSRFIQGSRFNDFCSAASQEARNHGGEVIFEMAFRSIFRHGLLNCDPHPGNYLFLDDDRIAFLDFGCVKRFNTGLLEAWRALVRSVLEGDRARFEQMNLEMGFVKQRDGFDFDYQHKMFSYFYRPFLYDRPFRYTHEYAYESFAMLIGDNPNKFKLNIPKDLAFTNRLHWGLNSVLATLNAESNWRNILLPLLYEEGETIPAPITENG